MYYVHGTFWWCHSKFRTFRAERRFIHFFGKVVIKEWVFRNGALLIFALIFFSVETKMFKASPKAGFFRKYVSDGPINPISRLFFRFFSKKVDYFFVWMFRKWETIFILKFNLSCFQRYMIWHGCYNSSTSENQLYLSGVWYHSHWRQV